MPCQSQSVESVSVVRSTGRSISHNSPVSFSISLSVSVGACTKSNTRPRALTSAVRSSALSISSLSLHFIPSTSRAPMSTALSTKSRRRSYFVRSYREDSLPEPRTVARPPDPRTRILGHAGEFHEAGRAKSRDRESAHEDAEEHDEEGRESGTRKEDDAPTTDLGSSNEANALS